MNAAAFTTLQDAVNATPEGGTLALGEHTLSGSVTIPRPMTLRGGALYLGSSGRLVAGASNVTLSGVSITGDSTHLLNGAAANYTGWRFEDCSFAGVSLRLTKRGRTQQDGSTAATGTGVTDGSIIEGCTFTGYANNYTIEIGGCDGVTVRDCHIHDTGLNVDAGDGIKVLAGSTNTRIEDCVIERCTRDAIDVYDASYSMTLRCTLRGCNLAYDAKRVPSANDTSHHTIDACTVESNISGGINGDADAVTVRDCTVLDNGAYGVRFNGAGSMAQGNYIRGHGHDIRIGLDATEYTLIDNDYVTSAGL